MNHSAHTLQGTPHSIRNCIHIQWQPPHHAKGNLPDKDEPIQGELPHQQTVSDEPIQSLCSTDELHQWNVTHINEIIYAILAEQEWLGLLFCQSWGRSGPDRAHCTSTPKSFLLIPTQHQAVGHYKHAPAVGSLGFKEFGALNPSPIVGFFILLQTTNPQ